MAEEFHKQTTQPPLAEGAEGALPNTVGRFSVERPIGKGGMSHLALAIDTENNRPVVLKMIAAKHKDNRFAKERFLVEGELLAELNHPGIVRLLEKTEEWLALEYVSGVTLRQLLQKGAPSLHRAIEMIISLAESVDYLHQQGVLHRDIKPENLLIGDEGQVVLLDFGIAMRKGEPGLEGPKVLGTPFYMSPEQKKDPASVTYASDLYALALTAYEVITGRPIESTVKVAQLPKGLQPIFQKALQPDPKERQKSVGEFIGALRSYLNSARLKKEMRGTDWVRAEAEGVREALQALLPKQPPSWRHTEVAFSYHPGLSLDGLFFDFLELPEGAAAIVIGEPADGVEGAPVHGATLRGLFRALGPLTTDPVQLMTLVNGIVGESGVQATASYLILNPNSDSFLFVSAGERAIWQIPAAATSAREQKGHDALLGKDPATSYHVIKGKWKHGDRIILSRRDCEEEVIQQAAVHGLAEMADTILRQTTRQAAHRPESHAAVTICLRRAAL